MMGGRSDVNAEPRSPAGLSPYQGRFQMGSVQRPGRGGMTANRLVDEALGQAMVIRLDLGLVSIRMTVKQLLVLEEILNELRDRLDRPGLF